MITLAQLIACGILPSQARQFVDPLNAACDRFDIMTPVRQAAFVAQAMHESAGFTHLEEILWYSTPQRIRSLWPSRVPSEAEATALCCAPEDLANRVYAARMGNGDTASGDGWKYRGRGLFQLTGRNNYSDAATELGRPYIEQPELVAIPTDACMTAAWFWHCRKLNVLADASNIDAITRSINGPRMDGMVRRQQLFAQCAGGFV